MNSAEVAGKLGRHQRRPPWPTAALPCPAPQISDPERVEPEAGDAAQEAGGGEDAYEREAGGGLPGAGRRGSSQESETSALGL